MELTDFIKDLEFKFETNDELVSKIKSPFKFLSALRDLNDMIGMTSAKVSVISQIKFLLTSMEFENPKNNHMLHAVIYGPPGVGKTRLGICLSKIWLAAGLFKIPLINPKRDTENQLRYLQELVTKKEGELEEIRSIHRSHLTTLLKSRRTASKISKIKDRRERENLVRNIKHNLDIIIDDLEKEYNWQDLLWQEKEEEAPIIVAGAPDLIAKHVGQTAPKTRSFFEANRGRSIFIDEAYALVGEGGYGFEAITELIKCMSEYPDTIVILGGYKKLMQDTIFSQDRGQPGFERRFVWVFDIPGYNPTELGEIFCYQLKRDNWKIDSSIDLTSFFSQHQEHFSAFGGDTEKLCFYAKQEYAKNRFSDQCGELMTITLPMMNVGIIMLQENKVLKGKLDKSYLNMYI